jgi:hypothetical protein
VELLWKGVGKRAGIFHVEQQVFSFEGVPPSP